MINHDTRQLQTATHFPAPVTSPQEDTLPSGHPQLPGSAALPPTRGSQARTTPPVWVPSATRSLSGTAGLRGSDGPGPGRPLRGVQAGSRRAAQLPVTPRGPLHRTALRVVFASLQAGSLCIPTSGPVPHDPALISGVIGATPSTPTKTLCSAFQQSFHRLLSVRDFEALISLCSLKFS